MAPPTRSELVSLRRRRMRFTRVVIVLTLFATAVSVGRPVAPAGAAVSATSRIVDTRPNGTTIDGRFEATGPVSGGTVLEVAVADRAGRIEAPAAAVLNLIAVDASGPGHAVVFECGTARPDTSNLNYGAGEVVAVLAVAPLDDRGRACIYVLTTTHLVVDLTHLLTDEEFEDQGVPIRLVDSRAGGRTVDGRMSSIGPVATGDILRVPVTGRTTLPTGPLIVSIAAVDATTPGYLAVHRCGARSEPASTLNFAAGDTIAVAAFVEPDAAGDICIATVGSTHLVVDLMGTLEAAEMLPSSGRLVDSRPGGATVDGASSGVGVRGPHSSTAVQVVGRAGVPADASAAILSVTAVGARQPGFLTVHVGDRPVTSAVNYGAGDTVANAVIAPIDQAGRTCIFNHGATDLVVDVVGWIAGEPATTSQTCPSPEPLFPSRRLVALYGNDTDARLGVLGEQPPDEAADRLAAIAEPYGAGDRPVQGAFELIATIATSSPGDAGLYRSPSSAEHVQRYLDAATEHGLLLILDIQPGQGDFLSELRRYESFLREPNVHVALDPEWNVGPGQVPGDVVGQVDATEVNEVADYLASLVAEHSLPEKMLVVHQFQARMLTRRELLREPAGVAIVIHMDGFGTQAQKLGTYDIVAVDPPLHNGFKLFFDEDIDIFEPWEVLDLAPVPDLITYQ
ncbi:MAG: hypothetical protein R8G01_17440 [Ilumatobacteraceae bacterium]|nr:hypothetical protein [Ilumatobacteraceae bacterium]